MAAYTRPSLATLIARIKGDISSRTEGSAFIEKSFELVHSIVLGMIANGIHGNLEWLRKQISPLTCDIELLLVWGVVARVPRKPQSEASGSALFPGTEGSILPADTEMKSADGAVFKTTAASTVQGGVARAPIVAVASGAAGNLDVGARLTLVSAPPGLQSTGVVGPVALSGGADLEKPEAYRPRVVAGLRKPPKGGGPGDYETWAKEWPGVTRAWEFGMRMGAGTVSLAFVMDDRTNIIPLPADVAAVQAYIDARRPIDMRRLYVQPPIDVPVNMTVAIRPNTAEVRAAVITEVGDLFRRTADLEQVMPQSEIDEAISTSEGEFAHEITVISSLNPGLWGLLRLGTITFTDLV